MKVHVVLNVPINKTFEYLIDNQDIEKYLRVQVPFGRRKLDGLIVDYTENESSEYKLKKVLRVYDKEAVIKDDDYELAKSISKTNFCSIGEALSLFIPKGLRPNKNDNNFELEKEVSKYELTEDQEVVFKKIKSYIKLENYKTFLLHGITGSGKTEIYFHVINEVIKKGKQVILLIPEIALTPQMITFFIKRIGDQVAVIHSNLKKSERLREFYKIKNEEAKVVIGPRSALFAPVNNLGAIIIDEEHDDSYKSNSKPRYMTKHLASKKAKKSNGVLILGSATPSIESLYYAKKGFLEYLVLSKRYNNKELPEIKVIDLKSSEKVEDFYLSKEMYQYIEDALNQEEQIILYLNRRGFSNIISCFDCGEVVYCQKCSIPMTYHKRKQKLQCHYCGLEIVPPLKCPSCDSKKLSYKGTGTEKIENILKRTFPNKSIMRFDADSVKEEGGHSKILDKFKNKEIDILIGTQMITKGHHFPGVTLVGIINADTLLNFPDFRANEKTFHSLVQVAGRAGRGNKRGIVLLQTMQPEHYAIELVKNQDINEFYDQEIGLREQLFYPPFSRILRIVVRSKKEEKADNYIESISSYIKKFTLLKKREDIKVDIIGPSPAPFEKIDENYRFHMFFKSDDANFLVMVGNIIYNQFPNKNNVFVEIDLDPSNLL